VSFWLYFCSAFVTRAILRFSSRFGGFNSRFGAKKFPFSRQREFAGSGLIWLVVFSSKTRLFGHNRKNTLFHGNNREFRSATKSAAATTIACAARSASRAPADRAPDALGGGGHRHVGDAERGEGVEDRVHHCRGRSDGAAFADTFGAERV